MEFNDAIRCFEYFYGFASFGPVQNALKVPDVILEVTFGDRHDAIRIKLRLLSNRTKYPARSCHLMHSDCLAC